MYDWMLLATPPFADQSERPGQQSDRADRRPCINFGDDNAAVELRESASAEAQ